MREREKERWVPEHKDPMGRGSKEREKAPKYFMPEKLESWKR